MGCWNGTCGISQLPITAGRKIKAFLMLQSEYSEAIGGAGVCYSTAHFRPWFFPVDAHYNDYGSVEHITKDWNSDYMLETFQKWLAEGKVRILGHDEAEINDPQVKKFETLDDVFDCVERGALVFKTVKERLRGEPPAWVSEPTELRIGIFMVIDTIYDAMLAESTRFKGLKDNSYYNDRDEKWLEKAIKAINEARSMPTPPTDFDAFISDHYVDNLLGDLVEEHYAFKHYKTLLYAPDKVAIPDFFAKLNTIKDISFAMTFLRKMWIPQSGQGSQNEELSFNKALVGGMNKYFEIRAEEERQYLIEEAEFEKKYESEQAAKKLKAKKKKAKKKS